MARRKESPPAPPILRPGPVAQEQALHAQLYTLLASPTVPKQKPKTTTVVVPVSTAKPTTTAAAPSTKTTTVANTNTTITTTAITTTTAGLVTSSSLLTTPSRTHSHTPSAGADAGGGSITDGSSPKPATGIIVGIALGVLVIIVVIAGLILRRRRGTKRKGEQSGEAELNQQQRMIGDNTNGLLPAIPDYRPSNIQNRPGGIPSNNDSMSGRGKRHANDALAVEDMEDSYGNQLQQLNQRQQQQPQDDQDEHQPDWWRKKPPLEYYRQVPPIEELYRTADAEDSRRRSSRGKIINPPSIRSSNISSEHHNNIIQLINSHSRLCNAHLGKSHNKDKGEDRDRDKDRDKGKGKDKDFHSRRLVQRLL
ncbi:hypothetical protein BGZ58_008178 [Dissophora ornata]|nr:hypothetical protein BGZ58_008178 [Dissophora ornata]